MNILEIRLYSTSIYVCHVFYNGFMFPQVSILFRIFVVVVRIITIASIVQSDVMQVIRCTQRKEMLKTEAGWPPAMGDCTTLQARVSSLLLTRF